MLPHSLTPRLHHSITPSLHFALRIFPVAALLLAGCAVGPNYERPAALGTNAMPTAFAGATSTNAGVWKPAEPSAYLPRGAWWEVFEDMELRRLEELATANNQDLASALARFGAKVIHPATVGPAVRAGIPVRVLNSRRPAGRTPTRSSRCPPSRRSPSPRASRRPTSA